MAGRPKRWVEIWFPDRSSRISLGLSMILAVFLWMYAVSEAKFVKDIVIPLELVNVPKGMVVLGEDASRPVAVQIQAPPDLLKRVREEDVDVKVDLSRLEPGPQLVEIAREAVRLPSSVELVGVKPSVLHLILDRVVSVTLPVVPAFDGELQGSQVVRSWSITPQTAEVAGPESLLEGVESLDTEPVLLANRTGSFREGVVPIPPAPELVITPGQSWTLEVVLGERRRQRTLTGVAVSVSDGPYRVRLNPETLKINVDGPENLVNRLRPQDFSADVDVKLLEPTETPYQLKPAVRFIGRDPTGELAITSVIPHYVAVTVTDPDGPEAGENP